MDNGRGRDENSRALRQRAEGLFPGGVNSPVRAFKAVGGEAPWLERGAGAWVWDVDGNRYVDYVGSWGALLLGHAEPRVVQAVQTAAAAGLGFGASTPLELELGEAARRAFPALEMLRFVSSGTEAAMSALRLARGFTGRDGIVKFEGCYHGHADSLLVEAGSGVATLALPGSAGVPADVARLTLALPYNDRAALVRVFAEQGSRIAGVIVEPVAGNMGCVLPDPAWLADLRRLTHEAGALLIVDEVMTGFRVAAGGACERYGLKPDLLVLGKILGGGLPAAAYGGRRDVMQKVAPLGPVYQAGTLSGNPVAMAAGAATLRILAAEPELYRRLEANGQSLEAGLREAAARAGAPVCIQRAGAMLTVFFTSQPAVRDYAAARASDTAAFARFHQKLLAHGVYWPPSQFEAAFISTAHGEAEIELTLRAARPALEAACSA